MLRTISKTAKYIVLLYLVKWLTPGSWRELSLRILAANKLSHTQLIWRLQSVGVAEKRQANEQL